MKKFAMVFLSLFVTVSFLQAQDVFFSEYIEGTSNNKALEIYNGTGAAIDLQNYRIAQSRNGGGWEFYHTWDSPTTLAAGDVWVITTDQAAQVMQNVADEILAYPSVVHFNGNDARALEVTTDGGGTWTTLDVIGVPDEDPGTGWSVAGVDAATAEHTLVRKLSVQSGNTDWAASAGTNASNSEWEVYPQDTFEYLGYHGSGGAPNVPPIADAGSPQIVGLSESVELDGSGSYDSDGEITSYQWSQYSGTTVTLNNADQAIANFTSPGTEGDLQFVLSVTDDSSATSTDTVLVRVATADPAKVFFSEYIEGSSYNKALEIYNATGETVDLSHYGIITSNNGGNWFSPDPLTGTLAANETYVILNTGWDLFPTDSSIVDTLWAQYATSFNGNDARGLVYSVSGTFNDDWMIVDQIGDTNGDPGDGWAVAGISAATLNHTLVRKPTVVSGTTDWAASAGTGAGDSEWIVYDEDTYQYLGSHQVNLDAPIIANTTYSPDFVTSNDEIEVRASVTPQVGTISSVTIHYGSGGNYPNEAQMFLESGNDYIGYIPAQSANSVVEFKVSAEDDQGNSGETVPVSIMVADGSPMDISVLRNNINQYEDQTVTLSGTVTIGAGVLSSTNTQVYIQDESGRGVQLFNYGSVMNNLERGTAVTLVGTASLYQGQVEITDFQYKVESTGNDLPSPVDLTIAEANDTQWEGTFIKFSGEIADKWWAGGGTNVEVANSTDTTLVRIWDATGVDTSAIAIGTTYWFKGVGGVYSGDAQLLLGYNSDFGTGTAVDPENPVQPLTFQLQEAYPNPFNPSTTIAFQLAQNGPHELAVYNILGQKITVLSRGYATAGNYKVRWNASNQPSGIYFIRLTAHGQMNVRKVTLLR